MNRDEVAKYIALCMGMWPQWKPAPTTADAWALVLTEIPYLAAVEMITLFASETYPPPPGRVRDAVLDCHQDIAATIAVCDRWYRSTDDVTRHPTRTERDDHPLAALVWDLAGGYEALHHAQWAHHRLRSVYPEALAILRHRDTSLAITKSQADGVIYALEEGTAQ